MNSMGRGFARRRGGEWVSNNCLAGFCPLHPVANPSQHGGEDRVHHRLGITVIRSVTKVSSVGH